MFEVNNDVANINGSQGKYDNVIKNPSVRYGKNAVDNYLSYIESPITSDPLNTPPILDFGFSKEASEKNAKKIERYLKENDDYLKSLPPLEFEYRYMPNLTKGSIDKEALLASAYEEMGHNKSVSVKKLDYNFAPNDEFSTKPLDVNNDGNIDIGEYSTSILAADMLSKSDIPDTKNIDGTINRKGFYAVLAYTHKSNAKAAAALYSSLYNKYKLEEAAKNFNPEA